MGRNEIIACPPEQAVRALHVLFCPLPDEERRAMVESIRPTLKDHVSASPELLIAVQNSVIRGAVLVQEQPGRTAVLWPPGTVSADRMLQQQLAQEADRMLRKRNVIMAQSLLPTPTDPAIRALQSIGFTKLTELEYMHASTDAAIANGARTLVYEPFQPSDRPRLAALIEATYAQTQDCPQLNGVRDPGDVLTGYQATGSSGTSHWFFVRRNESDVGVLLLAEHAEARQWELVYMGVVPPARHCGIGEETVTFAIHEAARARANTILLAVDTNNQRAKRLYRRCGFQTWSTRTVYWKRYSDSPA